ncbi:MAG: ABC transporter substrate-binding protein, partial [Tepidisphaeraceae bacterium]
MENRFGIKDLFLFVLLVVLIVVVALAMKQYDRQWRIMQQLQTSARDQTRELAGIRRAVEENTGALEELARSGISVGGTTLPSTRATVPVAELGDVFADVKAAQAKPDYALGDWLVDNFGTTVNKLTPLVSTDVYASIVGNRVQESLATRDPNTLKYVPLLARSWDVSPDGLVITFRLRKGVTFSDGHPFTADDVVYSYELIMDPKVDAPRARAYYEKIASVTKADDHTVTFTFKEPYFESFGLAGEMGITPRHFYSKFTPEQFNQHPGLLMGTGPYMLRDPESWRPGQQVEVIRNERYWGEPGPFEKIVYLQVEEDAAEMTMFRNGELDVYSPPPEQYRLMSKDPEVLKVARVFEYDSPLSGYSYIAWNQVSGGKPGRFADKRVRQAMAMLVDRQRVADEIFLGLAYPGNGPFAKVSPQNDPDVQPLPFDVERAKALLREAGFEDRDRDGVIEGADGVPFRFKLTYS